MAENITSIQAFLMCVITFCWGLEAGRREARLAVSILIIICSIALGFTI